jgi:hypothetical protein
MKVTCVLQKIQNPDSIYLSFAIITIVILFFDRFCPNQLILYEIFVKIAVIRNP